MVHGSKPQRLVRLSPGVFVDIDPGDDMTREEALARLEDIAPKVLQREIGDYSAESQDLICEYYELKKRLRS